MEGNIQDKFLHLLRFSIGTSATPPTCPTPQEWAGIYSAAERHAVLGVCACGIDRLPPEARPPRPIAMKWAMATVAIERRNKLLNARCVQLCDKLRADGFATCVLKGQGAALYYPDPLRRQSGDIDAWVDGGHRRVMEYVRRSFPAEGAFYHHAHFPVFSDVSVELHFTPSWMSNPLADRRLQAWFSSKAKAMAAHMASLPGGEGSIAVPTAGFNVVYMMLHIYRHLFSEGVGLRQLVDYYYLLKAFADTDESERTEAIGDIRRLGLHRFARALMFVLGTVLGVPDGLLIAPPLRGSGSFVADEVLRAGNFGRDNAIDRSQGRNLKYFRQKLLYRLHLAAHYPSEFCWGLYFTVWQKLWIKRYGYAEQKPAKSPKC